MQTIIILTIVAWAVKKLIADYRNDDNSIQRENQNEKGTNMKPTSKIILIKYNPAISTGNDMFCLLTNSNFIIDQLVQTEGYKFAIYLKLNPITGEYQYIQTKQILFPYKYKQS